jgi:hypothetical protein
MGAADILWFMATWLLRLSLLAPAYACWVFLGQSNWLFALGCAAAVFIIFQLQQAAHRQALGWIVDDSGERQKVKRWNRGHAIFTPTTRSTRIVEEAGVRDGRRKILFWNGLIGGGMAAGATYLWMTNPKFSDFSLMLFGALAMVGGCLLLQWLGHFGKELLYQIGWQDMKGAKVLDRQPTRPGLEDVLNQKVHGEGRVATLSEALSLLDPGR